MDCKAATQGTELDPSFKGDWTTRAVGVACSLPHPSAADAHAERQAPLTLISRSSLSPAVF